MKHGWCWFVVPKKKGNGNSESEKRQGGAACYHMEDGRAPAYIPIAPKEQSGIAVDSKEREKSAHSRSGWWRIFKLSRHRPYFELPPKSPEIVLP